MFLKHKPTALDSYMEKKHQRNICYAAVSTMLSKLNWQRYHSSFSLKLYLYIHSPRGLLETPYLNTVLTVFKYVNALCHGIH